MKNAGESAAETAPGWTVLAYLDGNGELEPEIAAGYRELEAAASGGRLRVLLEIGRLSEHAVRIIRPGIKPRGESWSGVRRYEFGEGEGPPKLLGNINMADPASLYDFLVWGLKNAHTDGVMLVIGGHACEYMGLMNDYSGEYPAIMGIPEFAAALSAAADSAGRKIDLLLIDACYCNNIETLYELCRSEGPAVKTLVTYAGDADAGGISFKELLGTVGDCGAAGREELAGRICAELAQNLVARKVNPAGAEELKRLFDRLAGRALPADTGGAEDLSGLLSLKTVGKNHVWAEARKISRIVSGLTIGRKADGEFSVLDMGVLYKYIPEKELAAMYYRLAFARGSAWTRLLCSRLGDKQYTFLVAIGFSPLPLPKGKVRALISSCNPCADAVEVDEMFRALAQERGWDKKSFLETGGGVKFELKHPD